MLLRSTRRLFQKTLGSLKTLFSCKGYVKIPKNPNQFSFNTVAEDHHRHQHQNHNTCTLSSPLMKKKQQREVFRNEGDDHKDYSNNYVSNNYYNKGVMRRRRRRERVCLVAEKLKELQMLDRSDVDHVLDLEEVLHYYSRLTCPPYLDLVDRFFMEIYSESFAPTKS